MSFLRRMLLSALVDSAIRSKRDGMDRSELDERARRLSFESDAAKLGVQMSKHLRDRLRRAWLKLRSNP